MRFIDSETVQNILTMDLCIASMRKAMLAVSQQKVIMPPRLMAPLVEGSGYLALMPGSATQPQVYGVKILSIHPDNPKKDLPSIQGFIALFDHNTGKPLALVEGSSITAIRTAATSGLATHLLARADSLSHGVIGTGVQAESHISAILTVRPKLEKILIWGRDHNKAIRVADQLSSKLKKQISACDSLEAVSACDIVSMVTSAKIPVLEGKWLQSGAHVNLVGPHKRDERESDTETIMRSSVYVDLMESALNEAGDLLIPIQEGVFAKENIIGEVGQLISQEIHGRQSPNEITLFKSLGLIAQDLYAAWAVYQEIIDKSSVTMKNGL